MRTAVIGSGMMGGATAPARVRRSHEVTLIDRSNGEEAAVTDNARAFAFTDVIPITTSGVLRNALFWLIDPDGPLSCPLSAKGKLKSGDGFHHESIIGGILKGTGRSRRDDRATRYDHPLHRRLGTPRRHRRLRLLCHRFVVR